MSPSSLSCGQRSAAAKVMALAIACCPFVSGGPVQAVTVAPGGSGAIGTLNAADFLPNPGDVLEIEFNGVTTPGVDYDFLQTANLALLDGRLELKQIDSFVPSIGQSFDFLEGLQVQFEFNSVTWPSAVPGVALELDYPMNPINGVVGVEFVAPQAVSYTGVAGSWDDLAAWNPPAIPTLRSDVQLRNNSIGTNRTIDVDTNHAFAQSVEISAAKNATTTLNVDQDFNLSATHGVAVQRNGDLAGRGTVVGDVTNSAGTVSPGAPSSAVPATLTIDGTYDQGPSGSLAIDLRGSTDLLSMTGDVTLGGTLDVNLVGSPPPVGLEFPIVQTTGGIRGVFDNFNAPGLDAFLVRYEEQAVYLSNWTPFDMDLNQDLNEQDIDDFLIALINDAAYMDLHGVSPGTIGDADGDERVDFDDIMPFEQALAAKAIHVSIIDLLAVPEPGSSCLLLIAMASVSLHCWRGRHPPKCECVS